MTNSKLAAIKGLYNIRISAALVCEWRSCVFHWWPHGSGSALSTSATGSYCGYTILFAAISGSGAQGDCIITQSYLFVHS